MKQIILAILLLIINAVPSMAEGVKPKDKVILTVNATVHATAQYTGSDGEVEIKDELTCQLIETVEYKIVSNDGKGRIGLERLSHKNHLTAGGQGSSINKSGGLENWSKWTYSIDPESSFPNSGIAEIDAGPPYNVRIGVGDFFRDCNGTASGTEKHVSGWEPGANAPTYETVPIEKEKFYAATAENWVFQSPEDWQLAAKGEMTELSKKLQATYTPKKDGGFFTSGSASHSYRNKDGVGMLMDGTVNISWSVQCGEGPERVNAVIIPKFDYKSWLPAAGTIAGNPGNTITFDVELRNSASDEKAKEKTAQFEFELIETSAEPGSCGNSPWNQSDPDLQILKKDNPGLESIEKDGQSAKSKKGLKASSITLSCFDGGAYTKLRVTAHVDGEKGEVAEVVVACLTNTGLEEVLLPFDEDGNHIADAWENDKKIKGRPTNEDEEDNPQGDRRNGDGLTIWEEYRGFLEDGKHIRTDPLKKDFFICDTIGGRSKQGIDRFASLSKLDVHSRLKLDEIGESRVINRNHGPDSPHVVDQHGVRMDAWSTEGLNRAQGGPGTPGTIVVVLIDTRMNDLDWVFRAGKNTMSARFIATVAHELFHCCNVWHHGQKDNTVWWHNETVAGVKRVYEFDEKGDCGHPEKGKIILVHDEAGAGLGFPNPTRIWCGAKNGQHSGNEDCVMRYAVADAYYESVFPDGRICFMYDDGEIKGQKLCIDQDGTGVNDPEHKPESRYGNADADRGDCIDKICVNDLYQELKK